MRIFLRKAVEQFLLSFRDHTFFILKYKMIAADHSSFSFHGRRDAMSHHILHLRMHFIMIQLFLFRRIYHRFRHGMRKMLFHTGCKTQKFVRLFAVKNHHPGYSRLCHGQSSCFIKDDGVCISHSLQIFSALDRNMVPAGLPYRRKYRNWHGKLQRTGKIHH